MIKSLIELNWNGFQDFLSEPRTDRFRMSKYLESVVQSQRNFSKLPRETNSSDSKSSSAENNSISASSTQSPLVPKNLFTFKEYTSSFPILHTLVLITSNISTSSLSLSKNLSVISISYSTPKSVTDIPLYPPQPALDLSLSKYNSPLLSVEAKENSTLLSVDTKESVSITSNSPKAFDSSSKFPLDN